MKAFNNDAKLKSDLLLELAKHEQADAIIRGTYGIYNANGIFKGCAVGCTIKSYGVLKGIDLKNGDHNVYESFGIPAILAHLKDSFFEGISADDSKTWPRKFLEAVPVGADLSLVWPRFAVWMLTDKENGVIKYAKDTKTRQAIQDVSDTYERVIKGELITLKEWTEKRNTAADNAAYAAAYVASANSAGNAANTIAYVVAVNTAQARQNHFKIMADKLLEIIKETT